MYQILYRFYKTNKLIDLFQFIMIIKLDIGKIKCFKIVKLFIIEIKKINKLLKLFIM